MAAQRPSSFACLARSVRNAHSRRQYSRTPPPHVVGLRRREETLAARAKCALHGGLSGDNAFLKRREIRQRCAANSGKTMRFFLVTSRPEGTRALTLDGLARCRDTDDTNRGYRDTRTIRWLTKMSSDEMSIDWPPKHCPPSEWRHETVPTEPPSARTRIIAARSGPPAVSSTRPANDPAVQRSRSETDHEAAATGL